MNTSLLTRYPGGLLLVFLSIGCLVGCLVGCWGESSEWKASNDDTGMTWDEAVQEVEQVTVSVEIRFNGRAEDLDLEIACAPETTVFSATMKALEDGDAGFEFRGEGETAFVVSIGGVTNEKAAGDNWVYRVNGELGNVGCGVAKLKKDDQITWSFGNYELDN